MSNRSDAATAGLAPSGPGQPDAPLLRVAAVSKAFGATPAIRSCSLDIQKGEVHAIIGENGSGKSTLVKLLSGVHRPDRGHIIYDRAQISAWRSPAAAQRAGIVSVFQEVLAVGSQSVLDNIWLGADNLFRRRQRGLDRSVVAAEILAKLVDRPPRLSAPAASLSLSDRQACCIARALVKQPRVLMLDESTSALDVATRDRLFLMLQELCARGTSIVFISHRMDEIRVLADKVTVMRAGESVATLDREDATTDRLVHLMTGAASLNGGVVPAVDRRRGEVLLRCDALKLRPEGDEIDLEVHAGELLGLAGLEGHGQDAFLQALRGGPRSEGQITAGGRTVASLAAAAEARIAYVPRDRRSDAIFPTLSILENFAIPTYAADRTGALLREGATKRRLARYITELSIKLADPRQLITSLSGGNQQKIIVARWLASEPRILLLNDPTRGVDLSAKRDLYRVLANLVEAGMAVVMLSTEVDEHVELMDRVLVFRAGSISAELHRDQFDGADLVRAFFAGAEHEAE